ncbi:MAG: hypothetical protein EOO38_04165 [Cytophagaceae bacterium]|nr:MAG: hypothetical protein EOO38_04165 [Cytophagaceae bacterium]
MFPSKINYDAIVNSIKPDEIQTVYVPEFKRNAEVVFVKDKLYIAEGSSKNRVWYPVQRDALCATPKPAAPLSEGVNCASIISLPTPTPNYQNPLPFYADGAYWPEELNPIYGVTAENFYPRPMPRSDSTSVGVAQGVVFKDTRTVPVFLTSCAEASTEPSGGTLVRLSRKSKRVHPVTGIAVPDDTPGAIPKTTFDGRRLVNPSTGARVEEGTPGAITTNAYRLRKRVNPVTGARIQKSTPGAISLSTIRSRRKVDPITGQFVLEETPGAINQSTFKARRLVDPTTGANATDSTKNPLPYHVYRTRTHVDPLTGLYVPNGTANAVLRYVFEQRGYIDPKTGARVSKNAPRAVTAAAYDKLLFDM